MAVKVATPNVSNIILQIQVCGLVPDKEDHPRGDG